VARSSLLRWKAATGLVEKVATGPCAGKARGGGRCGGEGGRWTAVLLRGVAGQRSEGVMERETGWREKCGRGRRRQGSAAERGRGKLSWHCDEVSFFLFFKNG
jgi:hypothetical protein